MQIGRVSRVCINRSPTNSVIRRFPSSGYAVIIGYVSRLVSTLGQPSRPCKTRGILVYIRMYRAYVHAL
jgi:hypothetical protein